jgi:hypothetical protein
MRQPEGAAGPPRTARPASRSRRAPARPPNTPGNTPSPRKEIVSVLPADGLETIAADPASGPAGPGRQQPATTCPGLSDRSHRYARNDVTSRTGSPPNSRNHPYRLRAVRELQLRPCERTQNDQICALSAAAAFGGVRRVPDWAGWPGSVCVQYGTSERAAASDVGSGTPSGGVPLHDGVIPAGHEGKHRCAMTIQPVTLRRIMVACRTGHSPHPLSPGAIACWAAPHGGT